MGVIGTVNFGDNLEVTVDANNVATVNAMAGGGSDISDMLDPPSDQTPTADTLSVEIMGTRYYFDADSYDFANLTLGNQNHEFNIGDTIDPNLTFTFAAQGGRMPYTYTSDRGTFAGAVLTVPTAGLNLSTNAVRSFIDAANVTVTDAQTPTADTATATATTTVIDNRRFTMSSSELSLSRFTTDTDWNGSFTYTNIPAGVIPVLNVPNNTTGEVITRTSISIPVNQLSPGANTISTEITDTRTQLTQLSQAQANESLTVTFFDDWFTAVGTQPANLDAMTAQGNSFSLPEMGTVNGSMGDQIWVAVPSSQATLNFFIGISMTTGGLRGTITTVSGNDSTGSAVTYNLFQGPQIDFSGTATFTLRS